LSTLLDVKKTADLNSNQETDWNAHLFILAGKKWVIFVNKKTLYSVVLIDVLKKDLKNMPAVFTDAFIKQLERESLLTDSFEKHLREVEKTIRICTTDNDTKLMGSLNNIAGNIKYCYELEKDIDRAREYAIKYINKLPSKVLHFQTPQEVMNYNIQLFEKQV
jgi:IS30 family transposase